MLYYLQRLRDEAHRFAIGSHRKRRAKAIGASPLEEIGGVGSGRKRALLAHFGSARGVAQASLADLEAVDGISKALAKENPRFLPRRELARHHLAIEVPRPVAQHRHDDDEAEQQRQRSEHQ